MGSPDGTGACVGKLSALSEALVGDPVEAGWPWCLLSAFEADAAEGAGDAELEGAEVVVAAADGRGPVGGSVITTAATAALGCSDGSTEGGELGGGCDGCVDGSSDGFMLGPYVGSFVGPAVLGL